MWLGDGVVGVVAGPPPGSPDSPPRLELHAKARLDRGALLATLDLEEAPLAADALGRYVLLGSGALDVRLVRYTPAERGGGAGRLEVVRHLSLMSGGRPLRVRKGLGVRGFCFWEGMLTEGCVAWVGGRWDDG